MPVSLEPHVSDAEVLALRAQLDDALRDVQLPAQLTQLGSGARARLAGYAALLLRWNQAYNLVSRKDVDRFVGRHLLDALMLLPMLPVPRSDDAPIRLLDIGSGGGLPGLALALAQQDLAVTLIDRSARKVRFLQHAVRTLAVPVTTLAADAKTHQFDQPFDVVTLRAVTTGAQVSALARAHLAVADPAHAGAGGRLLLMLGAQPRSDELPGDFELIAMHQYQLPGTEMILRVAEMTLAGPKS